MSRLDVYGLRSMYKGTFLKYCDDKYLENDNFKAYIAVKDLILSNPSTVITEETIDKSPITNANSLNIETKVNSINSIICKPLFINDSYPYCKEGETVMVFIFDEDIKKIFYAKVTTELPLNDTLILRRGRNVIEMDKQEIRLTRERTSPLNDIGITVSDIGVEISGDFLLNGENVTDKLNPIKPEAKDKENIEE